MQSIQVDPEGLDRVEYEAGQQGRAVGVEQPGQLPPDPIVVEQRHLCLVGQAEQPRRVRGSPLAQRVHRLAVQHQVAHHHSDRGRGHELEPGVVVQQVLLQQAGQAEPVVEVVDDRQRSQLLGVELEISRLTHDRPPTRSA